MRGGIFTKGRCTGPAAFTRTGRRGYHGLNLAACSLGGAGGGGSSGLSRTDDGLIYYSDFTDSDQTLDGYDSWSALQGTWGIVSNEAKVTTNGTFDKLIRTATSHAEMVVETRCQLPAGYMGHMVIASDASNYWYSIVATSDRQYHGVLAGVDSNGSSSAGGTGLSTDTWAIWKTSFRAGKVLGQWLDRTVKVGPTFSASGTGGPTAAAGFGLIVYQAQNARFDYIAVYKSTIITMTGLSGTMAWRLMDASDVQVAASAAQSGGSAAKEIGDLIDCPFTGYFELHDSTAFTNLLARYPSSGTTADIYGGAQLLYTP